MRSLHENWRGNVKIIDWIHKRSNRIIDSFFFFWSFLKIKTSFVWASSYCRDFPEASMHFRSVASQRDLVTSPPARSYVDERPWSRCSKGRERVSTRRGKPWSLTILWTPQQRWTRSSFLIQLLTWSPWKQHEIRLLGLISARSNSKKFRLKRDTPFEMQS